MLPTARKYSQHLWPMHWQLQYRWEYTWAYCLLQNQWLRSITGEISLVVINGCTIGLSGLVAISMLVYRLVRLTCVPNLDSTVSIFQRWPFTLFLLYMGRLWAMTSSSKSPQIGGGYGCVQTFSAMGFKIIIILTGGDWRFMPSFMGFVLSTPTSISATRDGLRLDLPLATLAVSGTVSGWLNGWKAAIGVMIRKRLVHRSHNQPYDTEH